MHVSSTSSLKYASDTDRLLEDKPVYKDAMQLSHLVQRSFIPQPLMTMICMNISKVLQGIWWEART